MPSSSIHVSNKCSLGGVILTPKYPASLKKSHSSVMSSYGHPNNSTIEPFWPFS